MRIALIITLTLLLGSFTGLAFGQSMPKCINCHTPYKGQSIHQPVKKNQCTHCHNPHVAKYEGLLQKQGSDLCFSCHKTLKKQFSTGVQHQPIQQGKCLDCHAAHAADQPSLLRRPIAASCLTCHTKLAETNFAVQHAPFAEGKCISCHEPHNSANDQLLKKNGDALCLNCHTNPENLTAHKGFPGKSGQCLSCHNPHGGQAKGLLRKNIHAPFKDGCQSCHAKSKPGDSQLCLSCHGEVAKEMQASHSHMLAGASGCTACHSPHTSDIPGLLKAPYKQLCKSCHIDTFIRNKKSLHPHSETEKCTDCHAAHGSNRLVMLNTDGNTICSRCHESQGEFSHSVGVDVIDPRTGQSMTCLSCHDPMGSDYRYNLKLSGKKALCRQCHRSY
jgi:predicted CXXCH cytochrome family protein